jgi:hypothetical protein
VILHEVRASRWVHLATLIPTISLTSLVLYFIFLRTPQVDAFGDTTAIGTDFKVVGGIMVLVGLGLSGFFARRLITRPASFMMTDEGFEYSPGGVSTGLVRWSDVVALKEETVLTSGSGIAPRRDPALAVVLRDPDAYIARYPAPLRPLLAMRAKMNSSPLVVRPADLGAEYERVKGMMQEQVNRNMGARA